MLNNTPQKQERSFVCLMVVKGFIDALLAALLLLAAITAAAFSIYLMASLLVVSMVSFIIDFTVLGRQYSSFMLANAFTASAIVSTTIRLTCILAASAYLLALQWSFMSVLKLCAVIHVATPSSFLALAPAVMAAVVFGALALSVAVTCFAYQRLVKAQSTKLAYCVVMMNVIGFAAFLALACSPLGLAVLAVTLVLSLAIVAKVVGSDVKKPEIQAFNQAHAKKLFVQFVVSAGLIIAAVAASLPPVAVILMLFAAVMCALHATATHQKGDAKMVVIGSDPGREYNLCRRLSNP